MVFRKGSLNPHYIDDAKVIYPWFSGKETPMNRLGDRNFGLVLTKAQADELAADGYQVKTTRPKDENGQPDMSAEERYHLKCKINYKSHKPPRIMLVTCIDTVCTREVLTEKMIPLMDTADIDHVDCKIGPYDREASDTRTAYVLSLFIHVNLDKYDQKYNDMPVVGGGGESIADAMGEPDPHEDD